MIINVQDCGFIAFTGQQIAKTFSITVWCPFFHNIFRKGRGLALIEQKEAATGQQCAEGSRSTNRQNFRNTIIAKGATAYKGKRYRETELAKISSSSCWGSHATFELFEDEIALFSSHCVDEWKDKLCNRRKLSTAYSTTLYHISRWPSKREGK